MFYLYIVATLYDRNKVRVPALFPVYGWFQQACWNSISQIPWIALFRGQHIAPSSAVRRCLQVPEMLQQRFLQITPPVAVADRSVMVCEHPYTVRVILVHLLLVPLFYLINNKSDHREIQRSIPTYQVIVLYVQDTRYTWHDRPGTGLKIISVTGSVCHCCLLLIIVVFDFVSVSAVFIVVVVVGGSGGCGGGDIFV